MKLISPTEYNDEEKFQECIIKHCNDCVEFSKTCRNKNLSLDIYISKRQIRVTTWNFANDRAVTKNTITKNMNGVLINRTFEPKIGGIIYSSLQWKEESKGI